MKEKICDLAVVGGGAAGLFAAVLAGRAGLSVAVIEKNPRVGKKLLATGNGTCNLTNLNASPAHYHGEGAAAFVAPALRRLPPERTIEVFRSMGVECVARPGGRVYPLCEQASAVLDCLRLTADAAGVTTITECPVEGLRRKGDLWELFLPDGTLRARRVLVAAGGAAAPALGGGNTGYALLISQGHSRGPLFPSIVQLKTDTTYVRAVKGIRADARVSVWHRGRELAAETGEILFTEYGVSGPAAMYVSRAVGDWERRREGEMTLLLDLLPTTPTERVEETLRARRALPGRTAEDLFTGYLNKRVGQTLVRACGISLTTPTDALSDADITRLAAAVKGFSLSLEGTQGFGGAQVTAGGILTAGFDPETMRSRLAPDLYAAGEVLDVDGDCGGYNLQWAWASAATAVAAMTEETK